MPSAPIVKLLMLQMPNFRSLVNQSSQFIWTTNNCYFTFLFFLLQTVTTLIANEFIHMMQSESGSFPVNEIWPGLSILITA